MNNLIIEASKYTPDINMDACGKVSFIGLILYGIMSILLYCFVYYICCLNKKSKKKVKNVIKEYFLTKKKLLNIINV